MTNLFVFFVAKKSSMTHNVHLTKYQEGRIAKGHKVRLTHEQLLGGPHKLHLKPRKLRKLQTAIRNHRGAEIHLEPDEACEVGGSILGLYEKHVKPHVRGFLHKQAARFLPHASTLHKNISREFWGIPDPVVWHLRSLLLLTMLLIAWAMLPVLGDWHTGVMRTSTVDL